MNEYIKIKISGKYPSKYYGQITEIIYILRENYNLSLEFYNYRNSSNGYINGGSGY